MRIIAGIARSRLIIAPKGKHTRPTQDYVRESLFSIIQRDVPGANVLDLFAGSGALALEALSRGAQSTVLADKSRLAIECIHQNVEILGFEEQAAIFHGDWRIVAQRLPKQEFDLVFLDPPYHLTQYREMTELLKNRQLLKMNALIVIEHRRNIPIDLSQDFIFKDSRTYGDTMIHFYRFNAEGSNDG